MLSRRHFLISATAIAVSHSSIARALGLLNERSPFNWYFKKFKYSLFINAHSNVAFRVARYYRPAHLYLRNNPTLRRQTEDMLRTNLSVGAEILQGSLRESISIHSPIKALGSRWSMSDVFHVGLRDGKGPYQGSLIATKGIAYKKLGFDRNFLTSQYLQLNPEADKSICFVQTGCTVRELNHYLESHNYALPTSGASDGQTFIGAISTGTHGAAIGRGSMHDIVRALHIMVDDKKSFILQKASMPVFNSSLALQFGAELISDDELFLAAVVSFGSFGIIHGAFVQTDPLYKLEGKLERFEFNRVKPIMANLNLQTLGYTEDPYHFEVILNPYATSDRLKGAFVQTLYRRSPEADSGESRPPGTIAPCFHLVKFVSGLTNIFPSFIPGQVTRQLRSTLYRTRAHNETWSPGKLFTGDSVPMTISSELSVSPEYVPQVLELGTRLAKRVPYPGLLAARYVKSTEAFMGFTCQGEISCALEIAGLLSKRTNWYIKRLWQELDKANIPYTWHWGKINDYDASNVREKFGSERVEKWVRARRNFLPRDARSRFSSDMLVQCQLT